jgi:hypothetical protein
MITIEKMVGKINLRGKPFYFAFVEANQKSGFFHKIDPAHARP